MHIVGSCPAFYPPVPPSPPWQGCSQSLHPPACIDVAVTHVQDPALGLVEPHEVTTGPLLELVQVPLNGILSFWRVSCTTHVICKFAEGALDPTTSLMKILNSTGPNTDPCGTQQVFQNYALLLQMKQQMNK